jgi:preprotein translocase subunit SecB
MEASLQVSALQLEGYYCTELTFKVRPLEGEPQFHMVSGIGVQHIGIYEPDPLTINVAAAAIQHPDEPSRWQHVLTVTSQMPPERKYPYDFQIALVGYFKVLEVVPPEHVEGFVKVNAASVLYAMAREMLATTTGRGPLPSVVLPTVVFRLDPEQQLETKAQAGGKKAANKGAKKAAGSIKVPLPKKGGSKKQQR